jgi:hypothetical protein
MKVLFISKADLPDFQSDSIFHGGRSVLGKDIVDVNKLWYMYKDEKAAQWNTRVPLSGNSYGRGFTLYGRLDEIEVDRDNINEKIESHFFDKIIYGSCTRCIDYIDQVIKFYDRRDIILVDGEDDQIIRTDLSSLGTYFKRELVNEPSTYIRPISFAIPKDLIVDTVPEKELSYATIIPGDMSTYIYDNEHDYFVGYQKSYLGVTFKKGGWDCLRHYEILMNGCIPYFIDLANCPEYTLTTFPKELVLDINNHISELSEHQLHDSILKLLEYTKTNLTTESLFNYIIK